MSILSVVNARKSFGAVKALEEALDRAYGAGRWFLYWDEDLGGHPIRGTITLAYGRDTLVVG